MVFAKLKQYYRNIINKDEEIIFTLNARDNVSIDVTKSILDLNDKETNIFLKEEYNICKNRLKIKGIDYINLKRALVPNQEKDRKEICLVIDTSAMKSRYGIQLFSELLPLLNKKSTCSIFEGDYIDIIDNDSSQTLLKNMLLENLVKINDLHWSVSNMLYLVYFNNISKKQFEMIINGFRSQKWFVGYVDVSKQSLFKSYLGKILYQTFIKNKNFIIVSHPEDCDDWKNYNSCGYPFEENGFKLVSINEFSYINYLSYKIESLFIDKNDVSYSINTFANSSTNLSNLKLTMDDNKWKNYLFSDSGKGGITKSLGYSVEDKESFIKKIKERIDKSYIYNIKINKYGISFNVCIEHPTISGDLRKTTVVLQYLDRLKEIKIVTIT